MGNMRTLHMIALAAAAATFNVAVAQPVQQTVNDWRDAFRQLEDEDWPSPNRERRATGGVQAQSTAAGAGNAPARN